MRVVDRVTPMLGKLLHHTVPRVGFGQRLQVFALDEDSHARELLKSSILDGL
jgi:hypothetical protein